MKLLAVMRLLVIALPLIAMGLATAGLWRVDSQVWNRAGIDRDDQEEAGRLEAGESLRVRALQQLGARPIDAVAFRLLGQQAETEADLVGALRFYRIAAARAPRDAISQGRLVEYALASGRIEEAIFHLDVLLRVDPGMGQLLLAKRAPLLGDARAREFLAALLILDPPWRDVLPTALASTPDPASAEALLALLATSSGYRTEERLLRTALLTTMGRPAEARTSWGTTLPAVVRKFDGLIFDGGFEYGAGPEPYGWRLHSPVGAAIGLDTANPAEGRSALVLIFDGRAVDFSGVTQDLALPVGNYRFDLLADQRLTPDARPFAWTFVCRETGTEIGRMPLPATTEGWQRFSMSMEIPAGCETQQLALVHEARSLRERMLSGRLAFDGLALSAVPR